jgi:hypothetical protein
MGYAYYDTLLGPAGYSVVDACHEPGCDAVIDRGLAYLCGNSPGTDDEVGCGKWFCEAHLLAPVEGCHNGTCGSCWDFWEAEHESSDE